MGVIINNVEQFWVVIPHKVRRQPNVSEACITTFSVQEKAKPETSRNRWQVQ
jgi:hypothetical protein